MNRCAEHFPARENQDFLPHKQDDAAAFWDTDAMVSIATRPLVKLHEHTPTHHGNFQLDAIANPQQENSGRTSMCVYACCFCLYAYERHKQMNAPSGRTSERVDYARTGTIDLYAHDHVTRLTSLESVRRTSDHYGLTEQSQRL